MVSVCYAFSAICFYHTSVILEEVGVVGQKQFINIENSYEIHLEHHKLPEKDIFVNHCDLGVNVNIYPMKGMHKWWGDERAFPFITTDMKGVHKLWGDGRAFTFIELLYMGVGGVVRDLLP